MRKRRISITEASRNFADCVKRAQSQGVTFVLLKNGAPVARLAPNDEKVCTGRDLASALSKAELTAAEAAAWVRDLKAARKTPIAPPDKWR